MMPLPWLIGGAIAIATAVVAKAVMSDNDSSSSRGSFFSDEEEERKLEREAKRKRQRAKLNARLKNLETEKREALSNMATLEASRASVVSVEDESSIEQIESRIESLRKLKDKVHNAL
jgi:DNA-binding transcriptional regulator YbjK